MIDAGLVLDTFIRSVCRLGHTAPVNPQLLLQLFRWMYQSISRVCDVTAELP